MATLKAVYTIPQLAHAAGLSRYSMHRLVKANNVQVTRSGRAIFICLSSLQKAMPELVETLAAQPERPRYR